jgi:hypothetical protein
MLLIYGEEGREVSPADQETMMVDYRAYTEMLHTTNKFVSGEALQFTPSATTVRVRDGATQTADGPFAETKEQLGGYYLVEAGDLDEAIKLAAQIPGARTGTIEVRPVMEFEQA